MGRSGTKPGAEESGYREGMAMSALQRIRARMRGLSRAVAGLLLSLVMLTNILALVGFHLRDRSLLLAFLLYLPLLPIGLGAVGLGLVFWDLSSRLLRLIVILLGLVSTMSACFWMLGRGPVSAPMPGHQTLSLLHWNVLWGGFWDRHQTPWNSMVDDIVRRNPDILVLSEAPPVAWLPGLLERLPAGRFAHSIQSSGSSAHAYHLVVCARWPIRLEHPVVIAHGAAAVFRVEHPLGAVRLMVVDGQSKVTRLRTPMLHDIAQSCAQASQAGTPIDLIVGDFNAISRSVGFDEFDRAGGGYHLASRSCSGWRGTWPSWFPVLDIDHVWVRSGWTILSCRLFTNRASGHRGQIVRLSVPQGPGS